MNCEEKRAKDQIGKTLQAGFVSARTRHKLGITKECAEMRMIMKKRRMTGKCILLAGMMFLLSGCGFGKVTAFEGNQTTDADHFAMDFKLLNKTYTHEMEMAEGEWIAVSVTRDSGEIFLSIQKEAEPPVYKGDDVSSGEFEVAIAEAGTYTLSVTGNRAKGSVAFSRVKVQSSQELQPETESSEESGETVNGTEPQETTAPENTEQSSGIPEAYAGIIDRYAAALSERWNGGKLMEENLNYMMADCYGDDSFQSIGYAVKDMDGNGTAELAIGTTAMVTDEFYGKLVLELYTLDESGNAVKVLESMERDRYYYAGGALVANLGSSGAADSIETTLKLEDGKLTDLGTITDPSAYMQMELSTLGQSSQKMEEQGSTALTLPILDEIDQNTEVGTAGSFMTAVQSAVKLLDWGTSTGLDPEEIREAAIAWLSDKGNDEQVAFAQKLASVDDAYQKLLGDGAEDLLASAGCEDAAYPWSSEPVENIEVIMEVVGLR